MKFNNFKKTAYIEMQIDPSFGWGNYSKNLCVSLISKGIAFPLTTFKAKSTDTCGYEWKSIINTINRLSAEYTPKIKKNPKLDFDYSFYGFGNTHPYKGINYTDLAGKKKIAVIFFEISNLEKSYIEFLKNFDTVITGSTWNKNILLQEGLDNVIKVIQGVDISFFNPIRIQKVLGNRFTIFSGGKLEIRKGQDIILTAFKEFIKECPNALLICPWVNYMDNINTISESPYTIGSPKSGLAEDISDWILQQGIPKHNFLVPNELNSSQVANLIKHSDITVFTNRCEGGTNLLAMESICCGTPTILSANSGHLDLMRLGLPGIIPINSRTKSHSILKKWNNINQWYESSPDNLHTLISKLYKTPRLLDSYKNVINTQMLYSLSWEASFTKLFARISN